MRALDEAWAVDSVLVREERLVGRVCGLFVYQEVFAAARPPESLATSFMTGQREYVDSEACQDPDNSDAQTSANSIIKR